MSHKGNACTYIFLLKISRKVLLEIAEKLQILLYLIKCYPGSSEKNYSPFFRTNNEILHFSSHDNFHKFLQPGKLVEPLNNEETPGARGGGGVAHWALEPRKVTLKSPILKI